MDRSRLVLRRKQLDLGYNTIGYARYLQLVPRGRRSTNFRRHPRTPDPLRDCSKRSFDGQIRRWRRLLHQYDNICSDEKGVEEITALQAESRPLYAGSLSTGTSTSEFPQPNTFCFSSFLPLQRYFLELFTNSGLTCALAFHLIMWSSVFHAPKSWFACPVPDIGIQWTFIYFFCCSYLQSCQHFLISCL